MDRLEHGRVHVYTGNGKGKTTAALGLTLRALGNGMKVFFAQFLKSGRTGEIAALECFEGQAVIRQYGSGQFVRGSPSHEDHRLADEGFLEVQSAVNSGRYELVVLDEANMAVRYGLLDINELLKLIDERPRHVEMVLTGRQAAARLIEKADLVTEMLEVKHYFQEGVHARKGIDL